MTDQKVKLHLSASQNYLLTDGLANEGITDPARLSTLPRKL
jgi:hypothetical protein